MADHAHRLGEPVPSFVEPPWPTDLNLTGRHVRVVPLAAAAHGPDLFDAYAGHDHLWDYMGSGPFADIASFMAHLHACEAQSDTVFVTFLSPAGDALGIGSFLRISPSDGSIEVGNLTFSSLMQGRIAATEAMFLMMAWAFEAGYRRYEWKCNALNLPSRRAAQRLGLSYEGVFRQATIVKGRNRDTAWFAAIDGEWPALEAAFTRWLDPANFDADGRQRTRLSDLTAPLLHMRDPMLVT